MDRHRVDAIDRDTQLTDPPLRARHGESGILFQLRRHPGGDEGLAGSDGAVMDVDASDRHGFGQTVPWFFATDPIPL